MSARSIRSLKAAGRGDGAGDFQTTLTLGGGGPTTKLGKASIRGRLGGTWDIAGNVGSLAVVGRTEDWDLDVAGGVRSLKAGLLTDASLGVRDLLGSLTARQWEGGSLSAGMVGSLKIVGDAKAGQAGDLRSVQATLTGHSAQDGQPVLVLRSAYVKGTADHSAIGIWGDAGSVNVGRFDSSSLLLGSAGLTGLATDFRDSLGHAAQHRLGSLTIRGVQVGDALRYFDNSQLGAWELGVLKFARVPSAVSGRIESHQTGRVINEPLPSAGSGPVFTIV